MLPKVDDFTFTSACAVMTARFDPDADRSGRHERQVSFNSGADDYLTKPFDLEELQARVKALLRRSDRAPVGTACNEIPTADTHPGSRTFRAIWFDNRVSPPGSSCSIASSWSDRCSLIDP